MRTGEDILNLYVYLKLNLSLGSRRAILQISLSRGSRSKKKPVVIGTQSAMFTWRQRNKPVGSIQDNFPTLIPIPPTCFLSFATILFDKMQIIISIIINRLI